MCCGEIEFDIVFYKGCHPIRVTLLETGLWVLMRDFARVIGFTATDLIFPDLTAIEVEAAPPPLQGVPGESFKQPPSVVNLLNQHGVSLMASLKGTREADRASGWIRHTVFPMVTAASEISVGVRTNFRNEHGLHTKVITFVRSWFPFYSDKVLAGLGENQISPNLRTASHQKGYVSGQPDITVLARQTRRGYKSCGFSIELKSPKISKYKDMDLLALMQVRILKRYEEEGFQVLMSNNYEEITDFIGHYFIGCKSCDLTCYRCDGNRVYGNPGQLKRHLSLEHTGVFTF